MEPTAPTGSLRPQSPLCDGCRKVTVTGKGGAGAAMFKAPDDVVVKDEGDGVKTVLVVRAEPAAKRSEAIVFGVFAALAGITVAGIAVKPGLVIPILLVAFILLLSGIWLSRLVGARTEFLVDGPVFTAKGWRGGAVNASPRDVRDLRIDAKGASVEHGRPRTIFDLVIALDDGTSHALKTQFRRHEYAEETVRRLRAALDRSAAQR